ncbi:TolC family protein [Pedobacter heparinus]|uniref:Outer membrane protein n=1 Tax=Pedobacter heparinus (strain ATCC 13125 / DSM 2366 / CIP 104194 / JCM 7457 / NBRC 12017 / NCIMB 9290 / NRRL B-14731 / HIM 762-3) TaxID=485917 RepID=C6XW53_PEDHD|nr:TolC family protein [Pedobacter heparinus]ACU04132.1 Outer membrane protein [Pedobacter heparinus DSM 2366]
MIKYLPAHLLKKERYKLFVYLLAYFFMVFEVEAYGQTTSLNACFDLARKNNLSVKQARSALLSGQYNLQAEKKSYLPKVDLLSSYTYLSSPLTINLQTAKDGIVNGSSQQSVNAANEVFKEITGNNLSQAVQDRIYNTSKNIIGSIYPDYNPELSKQSYFVAGLGLRQPIFLGNKLDAAQNLAQSLVNTASINVNVVNKEVDFLIALQYLRILYLNTILNKQEFIVIALSKNKNYADELVKNQILAPYQKSWTNVVLMQARSQLTSLKLDKQNAHLELNKLMGLPLDTNVVISDTLTYTGIAAVPAQSDYWTENPVYQLAASKIAYAKTSEKISKSFALPNIFAIGNYNLYQRDLPVTIPDWFVGVELQWSLFNGQTRKRTLAARQLVEEAKLAEENAGLLLQVQSKIAKNQMTSLENEVGVLDNARKEAQTTSRLITKRMENQLSSPKDVNDAVLIEAEMEKAYYTAVLGYYLALAGYFNSLGNPQQISQFIR